VGGSYRGVGIASSTIFANVHARRLRRR
jgi:hypothetical protein